MIGTESNEGPAPARSTLSVHRLRLWIYVLPLMLVPILILAIAIAVVPTQWFAEHSDNYFMVTMGYGSQLRDADCRVVIYGDSTAMIGVNPAVIRQITGLPTCNIAETEGMTMLNDTMVLDQFLQHNARPQYLVFLYGPENLNPQGSRHNKEVTTFEAVTWRFKQPHKLASLVALMRYPDDIFSWADHGVRMTIDGLWHKPLPSDTKLLRVKTFGQSALKAGQMTDCNYESHATEPDTKWLESLRTRYAKDGTTVFIDAMPIPVCDRDFDHFTREVSSVIDNKLVQLPIEDYYAGGRHVNFAGSIPLSTMVANQIVERMRSTSSNGKS